jgi:hypothetical protein
LLLGAIPSIAQRLDGDARNIYKFGIFDLPILRHIQFGWISFSQHILFFFDLIALIISVIRKEIGWMITSVFIELCETFKFKKQLWQDCDLSQ